MGWSTVTLISTSVLNPFGPGSPSSALPLTHPGLSAPAGTRRREEPSAELRCPGASSSCRNPSPSAGRGRAAWVCWFVGLLVCLPSSSSEGAGGRQSAGSAEEEACGFIWRLHNGTFTHRLAGGNWVDECLVMPPVQQVNSQDLAYIISREHLRPLLCLFPGALWHCCIPGSFCACGFPNKTPHLLRPGPH